MSLKKWKKRTDMVKEIQVHIMKVLELVPPKDRKKALRSLVEINAKSLFMGFYMEPGQENAVNFTLPTGNMEGFGPEYNEEEQEEGKETS